MYHYTHTTVHIPLYTHHYAHTTIHIPHYAYTAIHIPLYTHRYAYAYRIVVRICSISLASRKGADMLFSGSLKSSPLQPHMLQGEIAFALSKTCASNCDSGLSFTMNAKYGMHFSCLPFTTQVNPPFACTSRTAWHRMHHVSVGCKSGITWAKDLIKHVMVQLPFVRLHFLFGPAGFGYQQ